MVQILMRYKVSSYHRHSRGGIHKPVTTVQKSFPLRISSVNVETADLVTFIEGILNEKFHFLCIVSILNVWQVSECTSDFDKMWLTLTKWAPRLNISTLLLSIRVCDKTLLKISTSLDTSTLISSQKCLCKRI